MVLTFILYSFFLYSFLYIHKDRRTKNGGKEGKESN